MSKRSDCPCCGANALRWERRSLSLDVEGVRVDTVERTCRICGDRTVWIRTLGPAGGTLRHTPHADVEPTLGRVCRIHARVGAPRRERLPRRGWTYALDQCPIPRAFWMAELRQRRMERRSRVCN